MTEAKTGKLPDVWMTRDWIITEAQRQGLTKHEQEVVCAVATALGRAADHGLALKSLLALSSEPDTDGDCPMVKPQDFRYVVTSDRMVHLVTHEDPDLFEGGKAIEICRRFIEGLTSKA